MRGRKPVPTGLKLVRGNPGKRPLPPAEPCPSTDAQMPDWLSPEAQKHWPTVADQLRSAGLLTVLDVPALAVYCETFARWKQAAEQVARYGPVVKGPAGRPVKSPFLTIAHRSQEQLMRLLAEFGMTPSSRSRCTATKRGDDLGRYERFVKKT